VILYWGDIEVNNSGPLTQWLIAVMIGVIAASVWLVLVEIFGTPEMDNHE